MSSQPDNDINSMEIRSYLHDKHEMAYSYLLTIGAKALVLSEDPDINTVTVMAGMTDESLSSRQIRLDEVSRSLQVLLRDGVGVEVTKRGRNSEIRRMVMKIKAHPERGTECLVWKGQWTGLRHEFDLSDLSAVEFLWPQESSTAGGVVPGSESALQFQNTPFVRLTGNSRSIDLQFDHRDQTEAFCEYCRSLLE